MKVRDLCVRDVVTITKETNLDRAGALMRKHHVGCLPVVDRAERVIGVLTDRDSFLEIARRDESPSEIGTEEIMTDRPAVCTAQDDVMDCLEVMRKSRVRRLPVVDEDDRIEGIISIDDIICHAREGRDGRELPYEEVIDAFCEITEEYQGDNGSRRLNRASRPNGGRRHQHQEEAPESGRARGRTRRSSEREDRPLRSAGERVR
jgi:CBS domain-containing protein